MSRIQVDPKLFVTCRLCLDDTGQYQIVPTVQEQIKFCFDILVEPFDGLPQLICQTCEQRLSEYYKIKKSYVQKQTDLKSKLGSKDLGLIQSQQNDVTSSQFNELENEDQITKKHVLKRKRMISSSSSDCDPPVEKKPWKNDSEVCESKKFGCRLCNCCFTSKMDIFSHLNNSHTEVNKKFKKIFEKHCTVQLTKLDNSPNPTGILNSVILSDGKIIEGKHPQYYVFFSNREINIKAKELIDEQELKDSNIKLEEENCHLSNFSYHTDDTVFADANENFNYIEECSDQEIKQEECIKIDDSSNDSNDSNMIVRRNSRLNNLNSKDDIHKTIQNIVSMCQNTHKNRMTPSASSDCKSFNNTESQLKRKVLNIGRKTVNSHGFKCTGLLRYLESKNLEILWLQRCYADSETGSNMIHINTKLKYEKLDYNAGWIPFFQAQPGNQLVPCVSTDTLLQTDEEESVVSNLTNAENTKLLNPNPVANPKQFPKKNNLLTENETDTKHSRKKSKNMSKGNRSKKEASLMVEVPKFEEENILMPVITSTTSLAPKYDKNNTPVNKSEPQLSTDSSIPAKSSFLPRIKVKPDSELMSEKILSNINQLQNSLAQSQNQFKQCLQIDNCIQKAFPPQQNSLKMVQNSFLNKPPIQQTEPFTAVSSTSPEYVILDTVDLPNTKTESPIDYVKKLLNIYSIILLDTTEKITQDFDCLIKFKVCFKQELKDSVILCLSLFCKKNFFCIKVKDKNQENVDIDVSKISPVWQWEIIKVFQGDIDNKMLHNAQKVSQEVYEYVESFLCLLKSIKFEKPS